MNWPRHLLRLLGRRLPTTSGTLAVAGLDGPVTIARDRFGIPHITAGSDADAWFAVGFCHGQDRPFQLETQLRVVRGTLAELIGPDGLGTDRLARRIGFHRHGLRSVEALDPDHRALAGAYAAGVRAGITRGLRRRPHPFVLLRSEPTPYAASDALGLLAVLSFALAANWDAELARLKMLTLDGVEAIRALDPAYAEWHPASDDPTKTAGKAVDRVLDDIGLLARTLGVGGASNNWAIAGSRTASGRPILANDPHLAPTLPPYWYLVHLTTPEWSLAGASLAGAPVVGAGHNGHSAWGVTAGQIDYTDLFLEEIGPDGRSVRRGNDFVPCEVRRETIVVRGGDSEVLDVLETDRGPIVGPAFTGEVGALSLAATWLQARPLGAFFEMARMRSFTDLRREFSDWASLSLNVAYADADGAVGWQLVGNAPDRKHGSGAAPMPAADLRTGWNRDPLPFEQIPHLLDPECGFVATANNLPSAEGPPLSCDFLDGYRMARICGLLGARDDWDVPAVLRMQMDRYSLPWQEMRTIVLEAAAGDSRLTEARALLAEWDGVVSPGSPAAALFEALVAELCAALARTKAPRSLEWALGRGFTDLIPTNSFLFRRVSHLVALLRTRPEGWFPDGWPRAIADALAAARDRLAAARGPDPARWAWGEVRPLTLRHPLGARPPLDRVYDLGPIPFGGDANTINPAATSPGDPVGAGIEAVTSLRMVVDLGEWDLSRFVLPGGQSGNPFSRHYADQFDLWRRGDALTIPWSPDAVRRAVRTTLCLEPMPGGD
jgi:penicillin amidase